VPAEGGLAVRSAEQVARGLDSVQASARQSLPGIRPLGHTPSVSLFLSIIACFTPFNKFPFSSFSFLGLIFVQ
jgi:hypothetical protein